MTILTEEERKSERGAQGEISFPSSRGGLFSSRRPYLGFEPGSEASAAIQVTIARSPCLLLPARLCAFLSRARALMCGRKERRETPSPSHRGGALSLLSRQQQERMMHPPPQVTAGSAHGERKGTHTGKGRGRQRGRPMGRR